MLVPTEYLSEGKLLDQGEFSFSSRLPAITLETGLGV